MCTPQTSDGVANRWQNIDPGNASTLAHLAQQLGAHALEAAPELDRLRDDDAGVDDLRRAELAIDDHGATGRTERALHGVGKGVDALVDPLAGLVAVEELLDGHGACSSLPRRLAHREAAARLIDLNAPAASGLRAVATRRKRIHRRGRRT